MSVDSPADDRRSADGGAPTRRAATVILLREHLRQLEVLLVKRTPKARFMGGVWVFPGGAVDPTDGAGTNGVRAAAVRELREEAGILLSGPEALTELSRWVTPAEVAIRFDTQFFLARLPVGASARVDGEECVDLGWFTPSAALAAHGKGELALVLPTIKHLEELSAFGTVRELLAYCDGRALPTIQPRLESDGTVTLLQLPL
jgi:8-oxo-dGTP pyrophosphatase MutT (NUDIX family)